MVAEKIVKVEAVVKRTTLKAVLIEFENEEIWLPRSAMVDDENLVPSDLATEVKMLPWIAKEKGSHESHLFLLPTST